MDDFQTLVDKWINKHNGAFFAAFKTKHYELKKKCRELEEINNGNLKTMKLDKEMMDAKSDREGYKQECQKYDKECAIK